MTGMHTTYSDFNIVILEDEGSVDDSEFGGHAINEGNISQSAFSSLFDGWVDG
jgi:hypothetical protein